MTEADSGNLGQVASDEIVNMGDRNPDDFTEQEAAQASGPLLDERIRARAYELWQESGSGDGRAEDHWLQAEQEIRGQAAEGSS